MIRKVMVSVYECENGRNVLTGQYEAIFHQFGTNYEEFEGGAGNFTTAIIERQDGTIGNIPVEHIRFFDKPECG
ncbi:hypothetical protein F6R98_10280 [Candidatus Methylospira mobilis]|uniref:Uncharacterized protein n=1 Tax=Candidatus Methylospira mobilis TaxID=1808979 RepID=A0A5Q0BL79_9GAMM|nr:hypothetical protein [Candidatus Methylospira mobilis]QFY42951.1 hypothetical protein F6R98_10280 [Candidatus Methylospira mobilis]